MPAVSSLKINIARSIGALSRWTGRGGGTSLPGKTLLRLEPDAIRAMASQLDAGSVVISATNGKTTTASLLAEILRHAGHHPVHNHAGANMAGGVATALLDASVSNGLDGDLGLFEVDEAWTGQIVDQTRPRAVMLANLFRDQLDRYGELESLADEWREMLRGLEASTRIVLNADDPLLASLAPQGSNAIYFGVDDLTHSESALRHAADSKRCRSCGSELVYSAVQMGHLGVYQCSNCDFRRPEPQISATKIQAQGMTGSTIEIATPSGSFAVELPIPGLYNVYNAVAASATATALGIDNDSIANGLAAAKAVFGRVETVEISGKEVSILLIKNPTGANEVLRTITADQRQFDIWIALNDNIADGRDVSWIWDVDFEMLAEGGKQVTCSGTRAEEIALRLAYAGIDREMITVDHRIEDSFDAAIIDAARSSRRIFALPTYTALLELRSTIAKRGDAPTIWEA